MSRDWFVRSLQDSLLFLLLLNYAYSQIGVVVENTRISPGGNITARLTNLSSDVGSWICYQSGTSPVPSAPSCDAPGVASSVSAAGSGSSVQCTANSTDTDIIDLSWIDTNQTNLWLRACTSNNQQHLNNSNVLLEVAENHCLPKNKTAWAQLGCIVNGTQNGTTVSSLGKQSPADGYQSCNISCPIARQPFKVDAIAIQDDLIVIGETSIKLTVVDETLTGMKVVGGSVVTLMMEPLNFSDLKIDGNFTVSYGTYENRNIYSNIKCERSDSVYNISCLSEPLKPGIPRTSLYWKLYFFPNASRYGNRTLLSENPTSYEEPTIFFISSSKNMSTMGGDDITIFGAGFSIMLNDSLVYYGRQNGPYYQAHIVSVKNDSTEIRVQSAEFQIGAGRYNLGWFVTCMDQNSSWFHGNVTSYEDPVIVNVEISGGFFALNTLGGTKVTISGSGYGGLTNNSVHLLYGHVNASDKSLSNPYFGICMISSAHIEIQCTTSAGVGIDLSWQIVIDLEYTEIFNSMLRYERPSLNSISIFEDGEKKTHLKTDGTSSLIIQGMSFGPSLTPPTVGHVALSGDIIFSDCIVFNDTQINCTNSGEGSGPDHRFFVQIAFQESQEGIYLSYKSPTIYDVQNAEALSSHEMKPITITGEDFGNEHVHLRVRYGHSIENMKYSAKNCLVSENHTKIVCLSATPKVGDFDISGMYFKVISDGLVSAPYKADNAKYEKDSYVGHNYTEGLSLGIKTFDSVNNTLYVLSQGLDDLQQSSIVVYDKGHFAAPLAEYILPSTVTTLEFYHRNNTLLCTKYQSGVNTLGELKLGTSLAFVEFAHLSCNGQARITCRVKYGISALNEKEQIYYIVVRDAYESDVIMQIDLVSGDSYVTFASAVERFEIGALDAFYDIHLRKVSLNLISRENRQSSLNDTSWNTSTLNITTNQLTDNQIDERRYSKRVSLLDFESDNMSSVYAPSSKYSRLGHNINLRDGQQFIAYDVGVEEDKYAIPSVGGIDTYDLGLGYSLLTNGNLLNIEVPKLKLEFPDARVGWESFRLVLQADKSIRCYFLLVQKKRLHAGTYPTMEEVFTGLYNPAPAIVGESVTVRHYVIDVPVPLMKYTLLVGGDNSIPDTTEYDIYYIAHEGSFGTSIIQHLNASTVSQPPNTKTGYPQVSGTTVNSFVYHVRFSDRKGSVYYVVTDEFNLCDETALNDNADPTKDLRDKLRDCATNLPVNFGFGEFLVDQRETPIEVDENRGEFSGLVSISNLPPYRSYYVYAVGISFGQTSQFAYTKTRIDLVGFAVHSDRPYINEGDVNPLGIYITLSKRPHIDETLSFSCKIEDFTNNVVYSNLPHDKMGTLGYENWEDRLLVGHVKGVRDKKNLESTYEAFRIICSNVANKDENSIYKITLNIDIELNVKNVIWPEWSSTSILEEASNNYFILPEHKKSISIFEESQIKLQQLDRQWVGDIFVDGINATLSGIGLQTEITQNKRGIKLVLPAYSIVCPDGCNNEAGYQNLTLQNPHLANGSTGGIAFTSYIYYYEQCTDKTYEVLPSICYDAKLSSEKCAWGSGATCEKCPQNSICPGGPRAWPVEGYWSPSEFGNEIFRCRTPSSGRCEGYNITTGQAECKEGYDSGTDFCDKCADDYYEGIDGKCYSCKSHGFWDSIAGPLGYAFTFCLLVMVVIISLVYISTVLAGSTILSATEMTMRFAFESLLACQLIAIAGMPVNSQYFTWLKNIFQGLYVSLFDFRGQVYTQCVGKTYTPFMFETVGMAFVLFILVLFAVMATKKVQISILSWPIWKNHFTKKQYTQLLQGMLSILQLSYGAVTVNAFDIVNCKVILGKYRLAKRPSILCYEGSHTFAASISLMVLIIITFGFPIASYFIVKSVLRSKKNHFDPSLILYSFWSRSDLKKQYYWFREIRQMSVACLAGSASFFTSNDSRSGGFVINIIILLTYSVLILYIKPYKRSGGWIVSSLISSCVVAMVANLLSFIAWLTFDNKILGDTLEVYTAMEWAMLFSFVVYFAFNWWRFEIHVLSFRKAMSKSVGVRSHPQHRWAHHVHDILKETTKNNLRNVLQDGKSPNIKGKKTNKISPAAPVLSAFESKHTKVAPVFNNANRRKVTTVVPTRIGNVVRINVAENDGHQLPASWCFSHKKLHQHSKLRRIMSWWYSIQFLLQICLVIVTASMPYLAVPKDTEQITSQLQNRRFLSSKNNETESTRSFRADQYYLSAREALENATFQTLLITKGLLCAFVILLTVSRSRRKRGVVQFCTRNCYVVFEVGFLLLTSASIYGFYLLKNAPLPRYIAIACESMTIIIMFVAKLRKRRLQKRAARVKPVGTKAKSHGRKTTIQPTTSDRRGISIKKKNKIVTTHKKSKKGLLSFLASEGQKRNVTKVIPQSTVEGRHLLEEHVFDEEDLHSHLQNTSNIECILLLKPEERRRKELDMMRHEEERFHMSIEDSMALKIRDEPKRLLELERLRREDERQQMYEGEMSQIAVEEEKNRRREIKAMRMEEAQEQMFIEDARSALENSLFTEWCAIEKDKELMELDHMRQEENQRRVYLEEVRHLWLLDCAAHRNELAREKQVLNLDMMRREEARQRMFETETEQRITANLLVMHKELPIMRREEDRQRLMDEEIYRMRYLEEKQLHASQMSAIRVLQERLDSEDVELISDELEKVYKVFKVTGPLEALVKECEEFVKREVNSIKAELIEAMDDFENPNHLDRLEVAISKAWHLLHPKEAKLLEKAVAIEKELEHLRDITKQVESLNQTTIAEIKSFKKPNEQIVSVIVSLFILLGHQPEELDTWKKCATLMGKTGENSLKRRITRHSISSVTRKQIKLVKKLVKTVEVTKIQAISSTASVLFGWVMGVLAEYKLLGPKSRAQSRASLKTTSKKNRPKKMKTGKLTESLLNTATEDPRDTAKLSEERSALNADIVERDFDARSTKSRSSSSGRKTPSSKKKKKKKKKKGSSVKKKKK